MNAKPILFSGEMVQAILEDRKSMTRRVVKFPTTFFKDTTGQVLEHSSLKVVYPMPLGGYVFWSSDPGREFSDRAYQNSTDGLMCPYGKPGDLLWVKETFGVYENITCCQGDIPNFKDKEGVYHPVVHFAGKVDYAWGMYGPPRKRSGRFMPKMVCRIWLEVTDIRVERVNDISWRDAIAEGAPFHHSEALVEDHAVMWFGELWDSINKERGYGWDVNPWVWVVSFKPASLEDIQKVGAI